MTNLQMSHLLEEGPCPGSPRACLVLVAFPTPLGSWAPEERGKAELKCWSGSTKVPGQTGLGSCLLLRLGPPGEEREEPEGAFRGRTWIELRRWLWFQGCGRLLLRLVLFVPPCRVVGRGWAWQGDFPGDRALVTHQLGRRARL